MPNSNIDMGDIHWLMDILQNIDTGLVVLDKDYNIQLWNGFMDSHSGISPQLAKGRNLFKLFPDIPEQWFRQKAEPVFQLRTRTFTIWEQRPHLFHFKNYRPITGRATSMYQNTAIIPLESIDRSINHICVIIYDVTDAALAQQELHHQQQEIAKLTCVDHHTGLMALSAWQHQSARELAQCHRAPTPSTIAIMDLTGVNQLDDASLACVFGIVSRALRHTDMATLLDPNHLAVMLPASADSDVRFFIERIRKSISRKIPTLSQQHLATGIAQANPDFSHLNDWLQAAQHAMQQARQQQAEWISVHSSAAE
ncbi:diguanylate cyclase domain-containing protein [Oceanobacter mangrovi]|uniref:diguanylate cyclase domain-containing protein n=1 Tax=Oceanobacter mangrovi TaxID=2862510 RepID=UPI001C8E6D63|nr:diguanylate cyclase [Oceanobacter mangrovi]